MVWISLYLAPNKLEENKIIYYIYELIGVLKRNWVFDEIKDYHYCWGWNCWWLFFKGDLLETHTKAYMNDIIPVEDSLQKQCGRAQAGRGIDETSSGTAESVMNAWWSLYIVYCLWVTVKLFTCVVFNLPTPASFSKVSDSIVFYFWHPRCLIIGFSSRS